jgi:hypothetical protein
LCVRQPSTSMCGAYMESAPRVMPIFLTGNAFLGYNFE